MNWETLLERREFTLKRRGRYLVAELAVPHGVLSTSVVNGGQTDHVRFLLNHQSCEGAGDLRLHDVIAEIGYAGYHERICADAGLPADSTVMMGTAANMNYAAVATETDEGVDVIAVVTGGVEGNATCAGDTANWRETDAGLQKVPAHAGTINTMVLVTRPLTPGALSRAVVTITEGKSAALQRLAVPSRQSLDLATGTGTDQFCIAAPAGTEGVRTSTSPALRWQNGLEPSYTRGVFHALGRYGVRESTFIDDISPLLEPPQLELLRKNVRALIYEPLVGAAAHALATVLDRVRHGAIPASVQWDASVQQAAMLAANAAGRPDSWPAYRSELHQTPRDDPKALVLAALALGWADKWQSR
jgi:adenosylcobinamide amidohydrolase